MSRCPVAGGGDTPCARCRVPAAGSGTHGGPAVPACGWRSVGAGDASAAGPREERAGICGLGSALPLCFPGVDAGFKAVVRSLPGLAQAGWHRNIFHS